MLVLSRQRDESLIINTGKELIKVTIVDIRGDKVRLGTVAPDHVKIDREEVYLAKQAEKVKNDS